MAFCTILRGRFKGAGSCLHTTNQISVLMEREVGGMYSTSHLDDGISWFTGNPLEASSDRPGTPRYF